MSGKLTKAHLDLLRTIKRTRQRPSVQSDDWEAFCDLADGEYVEDLGLGDARITSKGRHALAEARRALQEGRDG